MPRIFDNIDQKLLPALQETLAGSNRADFCVGFFNLRGWKGLSSYIDQWPGGEGHCCRLLIGMQPTIQELMALDLAFYQTIDNSHAERKKKQMLQEFQDQLSIGSLSNEDEETLQKLAQQIKSKKIIIKFCLRQNLHAKLYLVFRSDRIAPIVGYLGSSNLTRAGLSVQGELNVDVLDSDACKKLANWFEERWKDSRTIDISAGLLEILHTSWAREEPIPPYHIYLKMAYHLSREARAGFAEFNIPAQFNQILFPFQKEAVQIAARYLNHRNGVLIGDVVGLGKTLMATTLVRIFQEDHGYKTLILCPKNLVKMWEDYVYHYDLTAKVLSLSLAKNLKDLPRYHLVVIDESHNLRNRDRKRYQMIHEYIHRNDSKVILLSATPYNKKFLDLSNQLRLFIPGDQDLGVRPKNCIRKMGGPQKFMQQYQCSPSSLAAFEKSQDFEDWRELMRLFMIRRTRSFVKENYAQTNKDTEEKFICSANEERMYFPERIAKTIPFPIANDQYAQLYDQSVVDTIAQLHLPRYGLGKYKLSPFDLPQGTLPADNQETEQLDNLSRAGQRLIGFCRTNLFKRLESSGQAFLQSIERHILRNYIFLYALKNHLDLPIGTQGAQLLDMYAFDQDIEEVISQGMDFEEDEQALANSCSTEPDLQKRAAMIYKKYKHEYHRQFEWISSRFFIPDLAKMPDSRQLPNLQKDLESDIKALRQILQKCGAWKPAYDAKLNALYDLLAQTHPQEKVLIFTQFADTVQYLETQLKARGISKIAGVTGESQNQTDLAWQFSPMSNGKQPSDELRVLITTDVLSEGQNLQDCSIVVNYDIPWALIRLSQRAGRVDRIGQKAQQVLCYSFLPADGIERILHLRARVHQRMNENAEVVTTDEIFFEDFQNRALLTDLYAEKKGILEGPEDNGVDLISEAYQIWKQAIAKDPALADIIPSLPPVVYSTKFLEDVLDQEGVLVYMRTAEDNDDLVRISANGELVTESQAEILDAAKCFPDTPALPKQEKHHELVETGKKKILEKAKDEGRQLGGKSSIRRRVYEKIKDYAKKQSKASTTQGNLYAEQQELEHALQQILEHPLTEVAKESLSRQLRSNISDQALIELVLTFYHDHRLCVSSTPWSEQDAQIICSMGLIAKKQE